MHYNFVIPYRDSEHSGGKYKRALEQFKPYFYSFLKEREYNFNIIYVEQIQDNCLFKTGMLNNVGFDIIKNKISEYTYDDNDVIGHHPVDQLPSHDVNYIFDTGACYIFDQKRDYPKVHLFKNKTFLKMNGYSNVYEGWGHEDTDMMERINIIGASKINCFYTFTALCCNGTGITDGSGNYSPKYDDNWKFLNELKTTGNIFYSGLNNLSYKLVSLDKTRDREYHAIVDIY